MWTAPLTGRVALVTGAGRGIGASHARTLAAAGAAVVVNDLSLSVDGMTSEETDVAAATVAEISAAGGRAVPDRSDIAGFAGAEQAVRTALDRFGRLDIVINNASLLSTSGLTALSENDLVRMLAVNVIGSAGTVRAAFGPMREQGYGRVVNTASEAALGMGYGAGAAYASAKAALWGLTMALADEGAPHGITVNAVSPGAMTRMSRRHLEATESRLDPRP